jgi:hypothetical protein
MSSARRFGRMARLDRLAPAQDRLVNGNFNDVPASYRGQLQGWTRFGATSGIGGCKKTIFELDCFEGEGFYFAQASYGNINGGALQTVKVAKGGAYELSCQVLTRAEGIGVVPKVTNCRIGLDPTGGRDEKSERIVWTDRTESKDWTQIKVSAKAESDRITVFLEHEMKKPIEWNLTLFDDMKLIEQRDPADAKAAAATPAGS